jgi:hypothetical protein
MERTEKTPTTFNHVDLKAEKKINTDMAQKLEKNNERFNKKSNQLTETAVACEIYIYSVKVYANRIEGIISKKSAPGYKAL